jgi:hypothetical protein
MASFAECESLDKKRFSGILKWLGIIWHFLGGFQAKTPR